MPAFSAFSIPVRNLAAALLFALAMPVASQAETLIPTGLRSQAYALMKICRSDYDRLCSTVQPGGGRVLACLQSHSSQLSSACAQAMPRAQSLKNGAVAAGVMPK
jgi:hypothetical protein